jgi:hypothetical protein
LDTQCFAPPFSETSNGNLQIDLLNCLVKKGKNMKTWFCRIRDTFWFKRNCKYWSWKKAWEMAGNIANG